MVVTVLCAVGLIVLVLCQGNEDALSSKMFRNGVNLQPSYYNGGNPSFGWNLMSQYKSKIHTVRIEIEPSAMKQSKDWISAARAHGYFVVATYHDYTKLGSDNAKDLLTAANWWTKNFEYVTSGNSSNFVVNVMNEWGSHQQSAASYSKAYNSALSVIRTVYKGLVIIDIPGWGQEAQIAAQASPLISDKKIVLSAHIYPNGWNQQKNRPVQVSDLDVMNQTGRPCIIGEFGTKGSGPVNVQDVVRHATRDLGWTVLGWAWNGDGTEMNMVKPAWSSDPTATSFTINEKYFHVVYDLL
jgi:hypothetical protein